MEVVLGNEEMESRQGNSNKYEYLEIVWIALKDKIRNGCLRVILKTTSIYEK